MKDTARLELGEAQLKELEKGIQGTAVTCYLFCKSISLLKIALA